MSYFYYDAKKIFYTVKGAGQPLLFLHGDAASSRMFEPLLSLYQEDFKVIMIDFLGNGRSDRVDELPVELWYEEAMQTIALLEHMNYGKVSLAGTSGGAWVALNVALERPDLVNKVIADSFDGRRLADNFSENLIKERAEAKGDTQARGFYQWCHGEDWESAVDCNTQALVQCAEQKIPLFHRPLEELRVPILLMGSAEDSMVRKNLIDEYEQIASLVSDAEICMFNSGFHPAMVSNAESAADKIRAFLCNG